MRSISEGGLFSATRYHFAETDSTIDESRRLASILVEGDCVTADYQREGRGQQDRSWVSPPKSGINLTMYFSRSLLDDGAVEGTVLWETGAQGALCVALGIAKTIESFASKKDSVRIKWPNDVLIWDRKVAGILTEVQREFILISCGLNVCVQDWEYLLSQTKEYENALKPIALEEVCNVESMNTEEVLETQLRCMEKEMLRSTNVVFEEINRMLWKKKELVQFVSSDGTSEIVVVKKINRDGTLLVENTEGAEEVKHSGRLRAE